MLFCTYIFVLEMFLKEHCGNLFTASSCLAGAKAGRSGPLGSRLVDFALSSW